jgi:hypothetical protein
MRQARLAHRRSSLPNTEADLVVFADGGAGDYGENARPRHERTEIMFPIKLIVVLGLACAATAASAQLPGLPKSVGAPDISSIGVGNATGALGYCVKNKLVPGGEANTVLDTLSGKPEVSSAPGYADGQAGKLNLSDGSSLSLDGVQGQAKSQVCNMVLKQAKSFM